MFCFVYSPPKFPSPLNQVLEEESEMRRTANKLANQNTLRGLKTNKKQKTKPNSGEEQTDKNGHLKTNALKATP